MGQPESQGAHAILVSGTDTCARSLRLVLSTLGLRCMRAEEAWPPSLAYVLVLPCPSTRGAWLRRARRLPIPRRVVAFSWPNGPQGDLLLGYRRDLCCPQPSGWLDAVLEAAASEPPEPAPVAELVSLAADVHWHAITSRAQDVLDRLDDAGRVRPGESPLPVARQWQALEALSAWLGASSVLEPLSALDRADCVPELDALLRVVLGAGAREALARLVAAAKAIHREDGLRLPREGAQGYVDVSALKAHWSLFKKLRRTGDEATSASLHDAVWSSEQ